MLWKSISLLCKPTYNMPVSYTHLDVYKRQVLYMESSAELIKWVLENLNYWVVTIFMTIESSFIPFPVSYTHLDVYKRQGGNRAQRFQNGMGNYGSVSRHHQHRHRFADSTADAQDNPGQMCIRDSFPCSCCGCRYRGPSAFSERN